MRQLGLLLSLLFLLVCTPWKGLAQRELSPSPEPSPAVTEDIADQEVCDAWRFRQTTYALDMVFMICYDDEATANCVFEKSEYANKPEYRVGWSLWCLDQIGAHCRKYMTLWEQKVAIAIKICTEYGK